MFPPGWHARFSCLNCQCRSSRKACCGNGHWLPTPPVNEGGVSACINAFIWRRIDILGVIPLSWNSRRRMACCKCSMFCKQATKKNEIMHYMICNCCKCASTFCVCSAGRACDDGICPFWAAASMQAFFAFSPV